MVGTVSNKEAFLKLLLGLLGFMTYKVWTGGSVRHYAPADAGWGAFFKAHSPSASPS